MIDKNDYLPFNPLALDYYNGADYVKVRKDTLYKNPYPEYQKTGLCACCMSTNAKLNYENCFIDITGSEDYYEYYCPDCKLFTCVHYIHW